MTTPRKRPAVGQKVYTVDSYSGAQPVERIVKTVGRLYFTLEGWLSTRYRVSDWRAECSGRQIYESAQEYFDYVEHRTAWDSIRRAFNNSPQESITLSNLRAIKAIIDQKV